MWLAIAFTGIAITVATVFSYGGMPLGNSREAEHARAIALAVLIIAGATTTAVLSGLQLGRSYRDRRIDRVTADARADPRDRGSGSSSAAALRRLGSSPLPPEWQPGPSASCSNVAARR